MSKASKKIKQSGARRGIRWRAELAKYFRLLDEIGAEQAYALRRFCPVHKVEVENRGGWYHCHICGCAVDAVDADGVYREEEG